MVNYVSGFKVCRYLEAFVREYKLYRSTTSLSRKRTDFPLFI